MTRPPLPILETVGAAYAALIENFPTYLQAAGTWFLLWVVVAFGLLRLVDMPEQQEVAMAVSTLVGIVANVAVAVSWHRLILLAERPAGPLPLRPKPFFAYFVRSLILVGIVAFIAVLIAGAYWLSTAVGIGAAVPSISYLTAMLIVGRILLVFPAAAIGETRMTLRASWAFTAHNTWRMFAGLTLSGVPLTFVSVLVQASAVGERYPMLTSLLGIALAFMNVALVAGFASYAYRHFTQDGDASPVA